MGKIKDNMTEALARSKSMSDSERKLNTLIMKLTLKKTSPYLIGALLVGLAGSMLDVNVFAILAVEAILCIGIYKKTKKVGAEFNDFKFYQGNVMTINLNNKVCNLVLKQGKTPVKIEIAHLVEDFKSIKKNDFIQIGYNKDKKIAMLYK